ncbi:MAG TPA: elongation factor P maturation arginine rhamnosyltransferase EarP, partial [Paenalcaligenes sp.]|nr:elongation factor P maturation arginine rhamnosyltransferase EarP [Paenalcaligenes sp.]
SLYQQEPTPPTTLLFAADQDYHYQSAQQFLQAKMSLCVKEDSVDSPTIRLLQLPFIKQQYFDQLLWSTDLNFVRGEDSWMQALWAQLPFIWQPYPQTERTHLIKLRAWLQRLGLPHAVQKLIGQWNQANPDNPSTPGNQYLDDTGDLDITALEPILLQRWQQNIRHEVHKLSMQDSLSARLIQFCKQKLNSR